MTKAFVLWLLVLHPGQAVAAGPIPNSPVKQDTSDKRYANDLDSADPHSRLYAARVLARRVKEARRIDARKVESIRVLEARQRLEIFDEIVAPKCMRLLGASNIAVPCARILGLLQTHQALDALRAVESQEPGFCLRRTVKLAIRRIEMVQ